MKNENFQGYPIFVGEDLFFFFFFFFFFYSDQLWSGLPPPPARGLATGLFKPCTSSSLNFLTEQVLHVIYVLLCTPNTRTASSRVLMFCSVFFSQLKLYNAMRRCTCTTAEVARFPSFAFCDIKLEYNTRMKNKASSSAISTEVVKIFTLITRHLISAHICRLQTPGKRRQWKHISVAQLIRASPLTFTFSHSLTFSFISIKARDGFNRMKCALTRCWAGKPDVSR